MMPSQLVATEAGFVAAGVTWCADGGRLLFGLMCVVTFGLIVVRDLMSVVSVAVHPLFSVFAASAVAERRPAPSRDPDKQTQ